MYLLILITCGILSGTHGLILPMTKPDGTVDLTRLVSHVTLLEQKFQIETTQLESEIQKTQTELQASKTELKATRTELQNHKQQSAAEITSLQDELATIKVELGLTSNELISAKYEVKTLKTEFLSLKAQFNLTVIDSISNDVKSNMADLKHLQNDFHSVQQTLDKTNTSIETLLTQVRNVNDSSNGAMATLHQEQTEMKTEMTNLGSLLSQLQSNVNSTVVTVNHVRENVTTVQLQLDNTTNDIGFIKSEITVLKQNTSATAKTSLGNSQSLIQLSQTVDLKTQNIAFNAHWTGDKHTGSQIPLTFESVDYNTGSYNATTGKFTAPVSGTYIFSALVLLCEYSSKTYVMIAQAGSYVTSSYGETPSDLHTIAIPVTAVTHVREGEQVWVETMDSVNVDAYDHATYFVGSLLSAD